MTLSGVSLNRLQFSSGTPESPCLGPRNPRIDFTIAQGTPESTFIIGYPRIAVSELGVPQYRLYQPASSLPQNRPGQFGYPRTDSHKALSDYPQIVFIPFYFCSPANMQGIDSTYVVKYITMPAPLVHARCATVHARCTTVDRLTITLYCTPHAKVDIVAYQNAFPMTLNGIT